MTVRYDVGRVSAGVEIVLAGGPALRRDGDVVAGRGPARRRSTLALAYLVLHAGRPVPAEELAEAVWPEGPPPSWRPSLRRIVSDARTWLTDAGADDVLAGAHGAYRAAVGAGVDVDVLRAQDRLTTGGPGEAAAVADALRPPLLPGLEAPWLDAARRRFERVRLQAEEDAAEAALAAGHHEEAVARAEEVIAVEPLRESAYRIAMAAHRDAGRVGAALRTYEACRNVLAEELGASPSPPTVMAYQGLLTGASSEVDRGGAADGRGEPAADAALAIAAIGTRSAVAALEARLATVELAVHPDPRVRLDLLLDLGRARWALSGATDRLRRISLAAGEAALALGSAPHLGAALALASTTTGVGLDDPDAEDLCTRATVAFAGDRPAAARILALRSELRSGGEAVALATEAVAIAREDGDVGLLLDVLLALDQALSWSPDLDVRLAVEAECTRLLATTSRWRTRPTFEPLTRLQAGDLAWYRAEVARLDELVTTSSQWEVRFYRTAYRAVLAHLDGRIDDATSLAEELLGAFPEEVNAVHAAAGLYLAVRRDGGGVEELLPAIESLAGQNARIAAFQGAVALGRALVGDHDGARRVLDAVTVEPAPVAQDHTYVLALGLLAEAVALAGDERHATALLPLLEPYRGQVCAGAHGTVVLGPVDGFLGLLHSVAGRNDDAVASHRAGLDLARRLDAPLFEARAAAWLASVTDGADGGEAEALAHRARALVDRPGAHGAATAVATALAGGATAGRTVPGG
jgi:DNA-binding SARP family transcriptional activator